ncbi:MAG: LytR/AlgR family response regulator transcription factor, partial [Flavobacteriales bacterium]
MKVVIDDERLARADLIKMLEKDPSIQVLGEASNADEGIDLIEKTNPDLVFLDIQMPGKTGFDMLEEMSEAPEVIFVTAYDEYALRAFEFSALDYLMKPVEHERLTEAIEKINRPKIESDLPAEQLTIQNKIFIKDGEKCWFV